MCKGIKFLICAILAIALDLITLIVGVPILLLCLLFGNRWIKFRCNNEIVSFGDSSSNKLIILVHGSGFCWLEYLLAIAFLRYTKASYTIVTLNLDGILSNKDHLGYDDYAKLLSEKLNEYIVLNKLENVQGVLIGHSMGGLVIEHLAMMENLGMRIKSLFSLCTPYQGAPLLQCKKQYKKRYIQMSQHNTFINTSSKKFEKYHIGSYGDIAVPMQHAYPYPSDAKPSNCYKCTIFGHYSTILNPFVWYWICGRI
jgi:pimeloyl-ACP methyl ester carboxylesterase